MFDSYHWSLINSNLDSMFFTIYVYVFIVVGLYIYIQNITQLNSINFFYELHSNSNDKFRRFIFMIILATFLGTPITLGFFYKIAVFNTLNNSSLFVIIAASIVNLIMLVFYLQASRHSQVLKKKQKNKITTSVNTNSKSFLVLYIFVFVFGVIIAPIFLDIISVFLC